MTLTCPNCGTPVEGNIRWLRMATCVSCQTSLVMAQSGLRALGPAGEMHDVPQLFGLGDWVRIGTDQITLLGQARFSYGRGFWDEFWGQDASGDSVWLSVDEGDIAVQRPVASGEMPILARRDERLGHDLMWQYSHFTVTETEAATCVALRGCFDEVLRVGEAYRFVNLMSDDDKLLSVEIDGADSRWFIGSWADPFTVTVEAPHVA